MRTITICAAATLLGAAAVPAAATSSASASIGPLQVQLFDLDTSDGITPGITFEGGLSSLVLAVAYNSVIGRSSGDTKVGVNQFDPLGVSGSVAGASASATISGTGTALGTSISLSGSASPGGEGYAQYRAEATLPVRKDLTTFTLTPNTVVVFTTFAQIATSVVDLSPSPTAVTEATASLRMTFGGDPAASGNTSSGGSETLYSSIRALPGGSANESFARHIGGSYLNPSATATRRGTLQFDMWISGKSTISPVPEVSSAWLSLAGLGALGLLTAKRRSRRLKIGQNFRAPV